MSCEQNTNKVSRLICVGLTHLSSKRGFYAGMTAGGVGLAGVAGILARARRSSNLRGGKQPWQRAASLPPSLFRSHQLPRLQKRGRVMPLTKMGSVDRCATCRTPSGSKPGAWYAVNHQVYCPDCAPDAANSAGADLVVPEPVLLNIPIKGTKGAVVVSQKEAAADKPKETSAPEVLPLERAVSTELNPAELRICLGRDDQGGAEYVKVNSGYAVLRADNGAPTGLGVVPALFLSDKPDEGIIEDKSQWDIVHVSSGQIVTSKRSFNSLDDIQKVASVLAQLDWNKEVEALITTTDLRKVNATITALGEVFDKKNKTQSQKAAQPDSPATTKVTTATSSPAGSSDGTFPVATQPAPEVPLSPAQPGQPPKAKAVVGRWLVDEYGGIGRVLTDNGPKLLMVDSTGMRYEVERGMVREPTEMEFQTARIAMPVDPARWTGETCKGCGQATSQAASGETWYRMNFNTLCPLCSRGYADDEGFEIGDLSDEL